MKIIIATQKKIPLIMSYFLVIRKNVRYLLDGNWNSKSWRLISTKNKKRRNFKGKNKVIPQPPVDK